MNKPNHQEVANLYWAIDEAAANRGLHPREEHDQFNVQIASARTCADYLAHQLVSGKVESSPHQRRVVCAAIRIDGHTIIGIRHFDEIMHKQLASMNLDSTKGARQGFVDQYGVFMDRVEACAVAESARQIIREVGGPSDTLFSENLY